MEEFNTATIARRSVHGILALSSRALFLNIISFGVSLVVFTILNPNEVGIYTAVIAMQRIVSFFTDFGLGAALVQKKEKLEQGDLTTSFTIQASFTLTVFLLIALLYQSIISFFNLSDQAGRLLLVLVFTIFLSSFKTIPSILLERKIQFHMLIIPQIVESIVFNILLIVLLFRGLGIDSFSFAFLASSLIGIPFYYYFSPWKIGIGIDRQALRHLKFGIQYQTKNILATAKDDLLTVILVKLLSFTEIGYIGFAQRLSFFAYRFIVDSVTKVTFSAYARIQDDKERLKSAVEKSLFYVSFAMFPILSGLIIVVFYAIEYFPQWQGKWEGAIVSVIFFSLNAMVSSLSGILVNVLDSTGRVKTTLKLMILWTLLIWVLTPLFIVFYGYNGVAIASFIVTLTIFVTIYLVKQIIDFDFIKSIYKPFISSTIMAIFLFEASSVIIHDALTLLLTILIGSAIYMTTMVIIAQEEMRQALRTIFIKT